MKVLMVAAGEGVRWENYRNVPKHIVEVEGQVLLHGTDAPFKRYTDNIVIVSTDPRYAIGQTYASIGRRFPIDFGKPCTSSYLLSGMRKEQ
jgi:choline kinase